MKHVAALLLLLAAAVPTPAQYPSGASPAVAVRPEGASQAGHSKISTDAYPLDTCIVSGRALGEAVVRTEARGRVFKLCSTGCQEKLAQDAASFASKLDQAAITLQLPDYPLDRCPISGMPLGTAVKPVDLVLDGHLVRLCGEGCRAQADRRRAQIVAGIEAVASARQRSGYPLSTCVITGDALRPETTVEVVHGTTLLRLGSQECVHDLERRPAACIREVRAARAKLSPKDAGSASPRPPVIGFHGARQSDPKPFPRNPNPS